MKAITLTQPWATLVAMGVKQVETRSWSTAYRGPLAIHAAKGYPKWARELSDREPFKSILISAPLMGLPDPADSLGMVLCVCDLWACKPVEQVKWTLSVAELAFGDYSAGRYAWGLRMKRVFDRPIPARGALGLWEWQEAVQP